jgi:acyl carrier protein
MTPNPTTWKLLTEIVEEMTGVDADGLTPDLTFDELGFDSLTTVEIAVAAEMRLGVRIEEDQLGELRTLSDAAQCIDVLLNSAVAA